jgi:hypothetical protein
VNIKYEPDSNLNALAAVVARREMEASACFAVEQAAAENSKQRGNNEEVEQRKILNDHGHDAPPPQIRPVAIISQGCPLIVWGIASGAAMRSLPL